MPNDKSKQLYDLYKSKGLIKSTSFEEFKKADDKQQNDLYELGKGNGLFKTTDIETFKTAFSKKKSQPTQETTESVSTSEGGDSSLGSQTEGDTTPIATYTPPKEGEEDAIYDPNLRVEFEVPEQPIETPETREVQEIVRSYAKEDGEVDYKSASNALKEREDEIVNRMGLYRSSAQRNSQEYENLQKRYDVINTERKVAESKAVKDDKKTFQGYEKIMEDYANSKYATKRMMSEGVKEYEDFVDKKVHEQIQSIDLKGLRDKTVEGYATYDATKVDEKARELAEDLGGGRRTYKKIKSDLKGAVVSDIYAQQVKEEVKPELKKFNEGLRDKVLKEFEQNSKTRVQFENQIGELAEDVRTAKTEQGKELYNEYKTTVNNVSGAIEEQFAPQKAEIDAKAKELEALNATLQQRIDSGEMIPETANVQLQQKQEEYNQMVQVYNQELEKAQEAIKEDAEKAYEAYVQKNLALSQKLNSSYERQIATLQKEYNNSIQEEYKKFIGDRTLSDEEKAEINKIYKKASDKVFNRELEIKRFVDDYTPRGFNFVRDYVGSLGRSIAASSETLGFDGGVVLGEEMETAFSTAPKPMKEWGDILDVDKMLQSSANLAGSMTISMGGTAVVGTATGGLGVIPALTASGLTGWGIETLDMTGQSYRDKLAQTGSVSEAEKASKEMLKGQIENMYLYSLEGLPFVDDALRGLRSLPRVLAGGALETGTEFLQESRQSAQEEAIRETGVVEGWEKFMTPQSNKETFLNILPTFFMGGAGQVRGAMSDADMRKRAKLIGAQLSLTASNPATIDQYLMQAYQEQGERFTKAMISGLAMNGNISEQELLRYNQMVETIKKVDIRTRALGLNSDNSVVYFSMLDNYNKLIQSAEEAKEDPVASSLYQERAKEAMDNAKAFALDPTIGGKFVQVSIGGKRPFVMTEGQFTDFLDSKENRDAIKSGDIEFYARNVDHEAINKKIEEEEVEQAEEQVKEQPSTEIKTEEGEVVVAEGDQAIEELETATKTEEEVKVDEETAGQPEPTNVEVPEGTQTQEGEASDIQEQVVEQEEGAGVPSTTERTETEEVRVEEGQALDEDTGGSQSRQIAESIGGRTEDLSDVMEGATKTTVGSTDVILTDSGTGITLESIETKEGQKGKGGARRAMQKLVNEADKRGVPIKLKVEPKDKQTSKKKLAQFYESMGFEVQGNVALRQPQKVYETNDGNYIVRATENGLEVSNTQSTKKAPKKQAQEAIRQAIESNSEVVSEIGERTPEEAIEGTYGAVDFLDRTEFSNPIDLAEAIYYAEMEGLSDESGLDMEDDGEITLERLIANQLRGNALKMEGTIDDVGERHFRGKEGRRKRDNWFGKGKKREEGLTLQGMVDYIADSFNETHPEINKEDTSNIRDTLIEIILNYNGIKDYYDSQERRNPIEEKKGLFEEMTGVPYSEDIGYAAIESVPVEYFDDAMLANEELVDAIEENPDAPTIEEIEEYENSIQDEKQRQLQEAREVEQASEQIQADERDDTRRDEEGESLPESEERQEEDGEVDEDLDSILDEEFGDEQYNKEKVSEDYVNRVTDLMKPMFPNVKVFNNKAVFEQRLKDEGYPSDFAAKGFVGTDGNVYLNPDRMTADTPVHEFGHIWLGMLKVSNPELYDRGVQLVKGSPYYQNAVQAGYANGDVATEEALAQAIGEKGAEVLNKSAFQQWLQDMYDYIKTVLNIETASSIEDMTLEDFTNMAIVDMVKANGELSKITVRGVEKVKSDVKFQVEAFHGSPYQFNRFTLDKIGTGEGVQAFGWGLYFTDLESIAQEYAKTLSNKPDAVKEVLFNHLNNESNKAKVLKDLNETKDVLFDLKDYDAVNNVESAIELVKRIDRENVYDFDFENQGNLYKVSIHKGKTSDQYDYINFDKPISDSQRKKVSDYIMTSVKMDGYITRQFLYAGFDFDWSSDGRTPTKVYVPQNITGRELYNAFVRANYNSSNNPPQKASMDLLEAGIDGIKYPAESIARGATSDTARGFNYVVFDENAISIEEVVKFQTDPRIPKAKSIINKTIDKGIPRSKAVKAIAQRSGLSEQEVNTLYDQVLVERGDRPNLGISTEGLELGDSSYLEAVKESPETTPEELEFLMKIQNKYKIGSNKWASREALRLVEIYSKAGALSDLLRLMERPSVEVHETVRSMILVEIAAEYKRRGEFKNAVEVQAIISQQATRAGQFNQALGQGTTPGAILRKFAEDLKDQQEKAKSDPAFKQRFQDLWTAFQEMKTKMSDILEENKNLKKFSEQLQNKIQSLNSKIDGLKNKKPTIVETKQGKKRMRVDTKSYNEGSEQVRKAKKRASKNFGGLQFQADLEAERRKVVADLADGYIKQGYFNMNEILDLVAQDLTDATGQTVTTERVQELMGNLQFRIRNAVTNQIKRSNENFSETIKEVLKSHFSSALASREEVIQNLIDQAGLQGKEAQELYDVAYDAFNEIVRQKIGLSAKDRSLIGQLRNGKLDQSQFVEKMLKQNGVTVLTEEESQKIYGMVYELEQYEHSPRETQRVLAQFNAFLDDLKDVSKVRKVIQLMGDVFYANILSGVTTLARGGKGVTMTMIAEGFVEAVKNPRITFTTMEGISALFRGFKKGYPEVIRYMKDGFNTLDAFDERTNKTRRLDVIINSPLSELSTANKVVKLYEYLPVKMVRALVALDALAHYGAQEYFEMVANYNQILKESSTGASRTFAQTIEELNNRMNTDKAQMEVARQQAQEEYKTLLKNEFFKPDKGYVDRRAAEIVDQSRDVLARDWADRRAREGRLGHHPIGFMGGIYEVFVTMQRRVVFAERIVPFLRIPTNAVNMWLDWSPWGFVRAASIKATGYTLTDNLLKKYKPETSIDNLNRDKGDSVNLLLKGLAGTLVWGLLYQAIPESEDEDDEDDWIQVTADGYGNWTKNQVLIKGDEWRYHSFRWKNPLTRGWTDWYDYRDMPIGAMMVSIGSMSDDVRYKGLNRKEQKGQSLANGFVNSMLFIKEQNYMQSLIDIADLFSTSSYTKDKAGVIEDKGINFSIKFTATQTKAQFYPNIYKQSYQTMKAAFGKKEKFPQWAKRDYAQSLMENVIKDVPYLENTIENDKVDALGFPVVRELKQAPVYTSMLPDAYTDWMETTLRSVEENMLQKYTDEIWSVVHMKKANVEYPRRNRYRGHKLTIEESEEFSSKTLSRYNDWIVDLNNNGWRYRGKDIREESNVRFQEVLDQELKRVENEVLREMFQ